MMMGKYVKCGDTSSTGCKHRAYLRPLHLLENCIKLVMQKMTVPDYRLHAEDRAQITREFAKIFGASNPTLRFSESRVQDMVLWTGNLGVYGGRKKTLWRSRTAGRLRRYIEVWNEVMGNLPDGLLDAFGIELPGGNPFERMRVDQLEPDERG